MKRKCSLEEKLAAIALVEQGMSARSVSDKLHLGHHVLFEWLAAYKERGIQGLIPKGKRPRRHTQRLLKTIEVLTQQVKDITEDNRKLQQKVNDLLLQIHVKS